MMLLAPLYSIIDGPEAQRPSWAWQTPRGSQGRAIILALEKEKQEDCRKLEASLVYTAGAWS